MPPKIRLAGPPPSQQQQPHNSPSPVKPNDGDKNFSPSQIPPPEETPPPASPDSNPAGSASPSSRRHQQPPPQPPNSPPENNNTSKQQQQQQHLRKRSDVTMRAEYEMALDRKHNLTVQSHQNQRSANLEGTGSERNALYDEKGNPIKSNASLFGESSEEEQLQVAKAALRAAKIRDQQSQADLRKAKEELQSGLGAGELRASTNSFNAPTTPTKSDVQIRKLDPQQLQQNAKQKREQLEEQKKAAREHKENSIFRGPEVAQVSAAAVNLKAEANFVCQDALDAMEAAIADLREEKDQLMIRLERAERGMREDASRAEGELHWIDYASAEAKRLIDESNAKKEMEEREKKRKEEMQEKRRRSQSFTEGSAAETPQQQQQKPTWK